MLGILGILGMLGVNSEKGVEYDAGLRYVDGNGSKMKKGGGGARVGG